jgi:hypothetical protein
MTFKQRLTAALEAMPKKELGRELFYNRQTDCHCALGALLRHEGHDPHTFGGMACVTLDTTNKELCVVSRMNDNFEGTNAQRHAHMLDWSRS